MASLTTLSSPPRGVWDTLRGYVVDSRPSLVTKALAEFTGCMIFHFLGSVSPTPATNATALLVLVYYTARMSGAHLNPALSMTFTLLGYTNVVELLVYWFAQFTGAMVGALWIAALLPELEVNAKVGGLSYHGCFSRANDSITLAQVVGWEAVCTFCFILPIFSVVWYTQHKSGYGNTGPIIVGLSLYAAASAASQWTGGALNPARALASAVVFKCPDVGALWYYVLGEALGALTVPLAIVPWYGVSASIVGSESGGSSGAASSSRRSAHSSPTPSLNNAPQVVVDAGGGPMHAAPTPRRRSIEGAILNKLLSVNHSVPDRLYECSAKPAEARSPRRGSWMLNVPTSWMNGDEAPAAPQTDDGRSKASDE